MKRKKYYKKDIAMRRFYYILILLFMFTIYLFSQSEGNELIKVDTVVRVDTVIISKIDTVIVGYVDHLHYTKKTNSIDDTILLNECKKTGMISAKAGIGFFMGTTSLSLDIPLDCNKTIMFKYGRSGGGMNDGNFESYFFVVGSGVVTKRNENFIFKLNTCVGVMSNERKTWGMGFALGADMLFKIFKSCYFSIGPDINAGYGGFVGVISLGINIVH